MSIAIKKLKIRYEQEPLQKDLYLDLGYKEFSFITKQEYDFNIAEHIQNANQKYSILNEEISNSKVLFFTKEPLLYSNNRIYIVLFNDNLYQVTLNKSESEYDLDELEILIKEKIYKENQKFEQIKKQIELYEKFESAQDSVHREPIPEEVRFEVWRRDCGKCVICGSQKNLEFDHIIPLSKGGSSTARNIQLLCQDCNRHKSDSI